MFSSLELSGASEDCLVMPVGRQWCDQSEKVGMNVSCEFATWEACLRRVEAATRAPLHRSADRTPYEPYVRYRHTGAVYRPGAHLKV